MSGMCPVGSKTVLVGVADNVWDGGAGEPIGGPAAGTRALLAVRARGTVACLACAWVGTDSVLVRTARGRASADSGNDPRRRAAEDMGLAGAQAHPCADVALILLGVDAAPVNNVNNMVCRISVHSARVTQFIHSNTRTASDSHRHRRSVLHMSNYTTVSSAGHVQGGRRLMHTRACVVCGVTAAGVVQTYPGHRGLVVPPRQHRSLPVHGLYATFPPDVQRLVVGLKHAPLYLDAHVGGGGVGGGVVTGCRI